MAAYEPYIPYALQMEKDTGIPAPIILGQAMLEGGASLSSGLIKSANNFFGVKGTGPAGYVIMPTKEEVNGRMVTVNAKFRKYNSPYESFMDHAKILQLPRYQPYLSKAKTLEEWASGIKAGGYATDSRYVNKLMNVITSNGLDEIGGGSYSLGSYTDNLGKNPVTGENPLPTGIKENAQLAANQIIKWVLLLVLFVVGILFLLQALPVEKAAGEALNQTAKIVKPVKAARKVLKAVK